MNVDHVTVADAEIIRRAGLERGNVTTRFLMMLAMRAKS
jgi:hypothetical protein